MKSKSFRIIHISDLHGDLSVIKSIGKEIEEADLIALSGDLTHFGGEPEAEETLADLLAANVPIAAVPGNCDREGVAKYLKRIGISVDTISREFNGFLVCGFGGSLPAPAPTPTTYPEEVFSDRLSKLLDESPGPDIAIIHQPPANTKLDRVQSGVHVGSCAVRDFIERSEAAVCLTGHIHESYGIDKIGKTVVVNPGTARLGRYAIIEISNGTVMAELRTIAD